MAKIEPSLYSYLFETRESFENFGTLDSMRNLSGSTTQDYMYFNKGYVLVYFSPCN